MHSRITFVVTILNVINVSMGNNFKNIGLKFTEDIALYSFWYYEFTLRKRQ